MSGVAGRSGRKMFVPTPEQRNTVRVLVGLGIQQKQICRLVLNRQTQKPLDHKTLRKHFAQEIATATAELHLLIGKFMLATIFGTPPPAGTVAIKDDRARGQLMMFFARTRLGWTAPVVNRPEGHVSGPIVGIREQLKKGLAGAMTDAGKPLAELAF